MQNQEQTGFTEEVNKPVKIFYKNSDTNKYELKANEFYKVLDIVGNRPFLVVSVNGVKKSGKSFILNYILRFLTLFSDDFGKEPSKQFIDGCEYVPSGFETGDGVDRTTIGVLMWPKPLIVKDHKGQEVAILLIDTQGCYDDKATQKESALIFSVSAQLSDLLIFNVQKDILRDRDLQFMNVFLDYAKHLNKVGSHSGVASYSNGQNKTNNSNGNSITDQSYYTKFNRLMMLIRDFPRDPNYLYGYYDEKIIPENAIKNYCIEKINYNDENLESNETKTTDCYEHISCFLMPIPGLKIQNGEFTGSVHQMDINFRQMLDHFVKVIFSSPVLSVKKLQNQLITGFEFKPYIKTLSEYISENEAPTIMNLMQLQQRVVNMAHVDSIKKKYKKEIKKVYEPPMNGDELKNYHKKFYGESSKKFLNLWKIGSPIVQQNFHKLLKKKIKEIWKNTWDENEERSRQILEQKVAKITDIYKKLMTVNEMQVGLKVHVLSENHKKLKDWILHNYDSLRFGSESLRNDYKVNLTKTLDEIFNQIKIKHIVNGDNLINNQKQKISKQCKRIMENECKGLPLSETAFESKLNNLLEWANTKMDAFNEVFDVVKLNQDKTELKDTICNSLTPIQIKNRDKNESLKKTSKELLRCVPIIGFGVYTSEAIDAFDRSGWESFKILAAGGFWLALDVAPWSAVFYIANPKFAYLTLTTICGGKTINAVTNSNYLFPTIKETFANFFVRCQRTFKKPQNNAVDAALEENNKNFLFVNDLKRDITKIIQADQNFEKSINEAIKDRINLD